MTYVLGKPFVVDRYTIAIVSRQMVGANPVGGRGLALACSKEPAYVVVMDAQGKTFLDMSGAKVPLDMVAARCPSVAKLTHRV